MTVDSVESLVRSPLVTRATFEQRSSSRALGLEAGAVRPRSKWSTMPFAPHGEAAGRRAPARPVDRYEPRGTLSGAEWRKPKTTFDDVGKIAIIDRASREPGTKGREDPQGRRRGRSGYRTSSTSMRENAGQGAK